MRPGNSIWTIIQKFIVQYLYDCIRLHVGEGNCSRIWRGKGGKRGFQFTNLAFYTHMFLFWLKLVLCFLRCYFNLNKFWIIRIVGATKRIWFFYKEFFEIKCIQYFFYKIQLTFSIDTQKKPTIDNWILTTNSPIWH